MLTAQRDTVIPVYEGVHSFSYELNREFIRNALKRDLRWRAVYGIGLLVAVLVVIALFQGGLAVLVHPPNLAVLGGAAAVILLLHVLRSKRAVETTYQLLLRQSPNRTMRYLADDERIGVELENASAAYAWNELRRLWRYPDVWLFEIVKNRSLMFPAGAAPQEMRDFIVARCEANGVRT